MEQWISQMMEDFGYWGVLLLITIENLFPPIPSEVILTFGGFMTTTTTLSIIGMIVVSTLGSVIGAVILYMIGRLIGINRLEAIVARYGKVLRIKQEDLHRANGWFEKYGNRAVFLCRFVPLIRSLISLPAGMAHMKLTPFLFLTTAGSFIWNAVLILLGAMVGDSWDKIVSFMDVYSYIVYGMLAVGCMLLLMLWIRRLKANPR